MQIQTLTVGPVGTNCYLIGKKDREDCVLIDPGAEPERITAALAGRRPAAILLTHGHFDHIGAVEALADICPRVFLHPLDHPMLTDPSLNAGGLLLGRQVTVNRAAAPVREGDELELAGLRIRVLHTPGHTPGSVCYRAEDCLFSGDTLFHHGWGRTDLPGGSQTQLFASLRRLIPLIRDLRIFPGHED